MKKISFTTIFVLLTTFSFAQPILTTIIDGSCNQRPRMIQLYANGTVDFTNLSLVRRTNGNNWDNNTNVVSLSSLGILTNQYIYLVRNNSNRNAIQNEFSFIDTNEIFVLGNVVNGNGNDSFRIIDASDNTIDEFGGATNGVGETWEYTGSYTQRATGTGPDATFVEFNWIFGDVDELDGEGANCNGNPLESIINLNNFNGTVLSTQNNELENLVLYPNPVTNGKLNITIPNTIVTKTSIRMFSVLGSEIKLNTQTLFTGRNELDISSISSGIYIIEFLADNKYARKKIVVRR